MFVIFLILVSVFCHPVLADSRIDDVKINGDRYVEGQILFQGENIKLVFDLDSKYDFSLQEEKGLNIISQSHKGDSCTIFFDVSEDFSGDTELKVLIEYQGRNLGQETFSFEIEKPYKLDMEVIFPESGNDETAKVRFFVSSGLTEEEEDILDLKYSWKVYKEGSSRPYSFSGNDQKKSFDEGIYQGTVTLEDRLDRKFSNSFAFIIKNTDEDGTVLLNVSNTPRTFIPGERFCFDFSGTYMDGSYLVIIYADGEQIADFYYSDNKRDFLKCHVFETSGNKNIVVEVKEFGSKSYLAKKSFVISDATYSVQTKGIAAVSTISQKEASSEYTYSNPVSDEEKQAMREKINEKENSKAVPSCSFSLTVAAIILACYLLKKRKKKL